MTKNPNRGAKRPLLRQVELQVGLDVPEDATLDYITTFLSSEENWYASPYGYSLAGALFARAFMRERHFTESLYRFGLRFRVGVPMIHKHATNSGNPTLNTMEEIARRKGLNLFEFLGFTPHEIRRAYRRLGLDFDAEQARAMRINTHPRYLAMKRGSARVDAFRQRRPEMVETLGEPTPKAPNWPPKKRGRPFKNKPPAPTEPDPASSGSNVSEVVPAMRQPDAARQGIPLSVSEPSSPDPHNAGPIQSAEPVANPVAEPPSEPSAKPRAARMPGRARRQPSSKLGRARLRPKPKPSQTPT